MAKIYMLVPADRDGANYNIRPYKRKKDAIEMASFLVREEGKELVVDCKRSALGFIYNRGELDRGYEIITRDVM